MSLHLQRNGSVNTTTSTIAPVTTAYVATLRRQRATVWCDRSQPEDSRLLAAQKAARTKAAMEVIGSSSSAALKVSAHGLGSGSSSTTSVRGAKGNKLGRGSTSFTTMGIGTGSLVGGPPARLSATEATGDSSDDEDTMYMAGTHKRSGSGRSSLNPNHRKPNCGPTNFGNEQRNLSYGALQQQTSRESSSSYSPTMSTTELADHGKARISSNVVGPHISEERTPDARHSQDYFEILQPPMDKASLKRRGSVDEGQARTMTMSGLRLVVANPD
ncbi:hypothetical protein EDC01DRAFT_253034 [Geopyxis carbonaria]|nr:hypothetical protein EDC01DRAFT_253034 [Geopyxis carbonaria]